MPDASGAADEVTALRTENGRLRVLLRDRDARIAELEERIARLERLISRNLYRFRTQRRCCSLRFGRMNRLRQDRGLCPSACSTCS
jgi:hypothetical protein